MLKVDSTGKGGVEGRGAEGAGRAGALNELDEEVGRERVGGEETGGEAQGAEGEGALTSAFSTEDVLAVSSPGASRCSEVFFMARCMK